MMPVTDWIIASLAFGVAAIGLHFFILRRKEVMLSRAARLARAGELLDRHMEAFSAFTEDAAAPVALKRLLVTFSAIISLEETAKEFAVAFGNGNSRVSEKTESYISGLSNLRTHRPDLAEKFDAAMSAGILYMLSRWPDTVPALDDAMRRFALDPSRGVSFAARVVDRRPQEHDQRNPRTMEPAMA